MGNLLLTAGTIGATSAAKFWPSIVSGAKVAGTAALGFLGFGEVGAGVAAAVGAKTVKGAIVKGATGLAIGYGLNQAGGIHLTSDPVSNTVDFFKGIDVGDIFTTTSKGTMFDDTKKTAGLNPNVSEGFPTWAKWTISAGVIIGTVLLVKGALK